MLITYCPDILGITETWLHSEIEDAEICFAGYKVFRKDRKRTERQRGGGVALYIQQDLNPIYRDELIVDDTIETLICSLESDNVGKPVRIGICYRPPNFQGNSDNALIEKISELCQTNDHIVLMGDFNFSDIDWNCSGTLNQSHPFVECLDNKFLSQIVDKPTRGKNYLDLVITSDVGDHQMIKFTLNSVKQAESHTSI